MTKNVKAELLSTLHELGYGKEDIKHDVITHLGLSDEPLKYVLSGASNLKTSLYLEALNFDYKETAPGRELLEGFVILNDGSWLERENYINFDTSEYREWWQHRKCPDIEQHT